jgi:hypothetical protein
MVAHLIPAKPKWKKPKINALCKSKHMSFATAEQSWIGQFLKENYTHNLYQSIQDKLIREHTKLMAIGMLIFKWSQVARLSPVHVAAYRWLPRNPACVKINGLLLGFASNIPSNVDLACNIPYTCQRTHTHTHPRNFEPWSTNVLQLQSTKTPERKMIKRIAECTLW